MSRLPSQMNHSFRSVPVPQRQRSSFDRSHTYKTTFDSDYLIPYYVDEVLPGDTISLKSQIFARLSPLVFPIMDNVHLDTHFFFVPTRLLWANWEKFNGAQDDPGDSIDFEVPVMEPGEGGEVGEGLLLDYFGIPTQIQFEAADYPNALPARMYNFVWNSWFRDQNMQDSVPFPTDDGPDPYQNYQLLKRGKRFDYFTSALIEPQKGPDVMIPLGDTAPVVGNGTTLGLFDGSNEFGLGYTTVGGVDQVAAVRNRVFNTARGTAMGASEGFTNQVSLGVVLDGTESGLIADLSAATGINVNELREAIAFQHVLERDMRGGTRYVEHILAHWGVQVPDFRLQRPEYLGGGTQMINVSAVPQTSASPETPTSRNQQGGLAAYTHVSHKSGFTKSFPEHGYVMGLVSVRADLTYQQGLRKLWSRRTRFDFALPDLAHLGEQPIYMKEIYFRDTEAENLEVFGYQERFAEYRYFPSMVTGKMRSNATGTLEAWHLATEFTSVPALDNAFIQSSTDLDRVVAVPSEPHIIFDSFQKIRHARCLPVYAVPGLERL